MTPIVIGVEGLGNFGVLKPYLEMIREKYKLSTDHVSYAGKIPQYTKPVILIGHSFGAGLVTEELIKNPERYWAAFTFDVRRHDKRFFSLFDILIPWQKKFFQNVVPQYNFYRHGFMPGYEVRGLPVINHKVKGNHMTFMYETDISNEVCFQIERILKAQEGYEFT